MADLIDRERELEALESAAAARGGQLAIVWGRRRVGKTYLLEAFGRRRRSLYYTATQQSAPVELAAFTDAVREQLGAEGLPSGYAFPDWSTALDVVTERAGSERLVVVLDEFPYLAGSTPGLESVVQRWWDQRGRRSGVMLVLCGSAVAYMTALAGAAAPLHQRATLSLHVLPLDYRAAGRFVERLKPAERAAMYGICGGTPLYLEQWDAESDLRANLVRLFGSPASPLVDAAELVLSGELPETEGAFRILTAVAIGKTRPGEIGDYARVAVERPLKRLTTLGILERRVPALDDPDKTKRAIYRIADPYFAFWFRFIGSHRADIARGLGAQLVERRILPGLDDYMGPVFEDLAREHARWLAAAGELQADRVEGWWSADGKHEIDLVGLSGRDVSFVGEAKWSQRAVRRDVLTRLDLHKQALPAAFLSPLRLLYGRTGCLEEVRNQRGVRCFSAADLYA
ncbi:MAG: ATP-binding protein [Candidatus Limnocylindria bacterium]